MAFQTLIDVDSAKTLLGQPQVAVLDCRFDLMNPAGGRDAFLRGHIPGARYADLNRDLAAPATARSGRHPLPAPDRFAASLGRLGVTNQFQVVAYDDANGMYAARLWWMLRWVGHTAVAVLDGGFKAWVAAGGATEAGSPDARAGSAVFRVAPGNDSNRFVDADAVADALQDPKHLLVDARAPERFSGSVEPIDSVAGHVPGAANHPFTLNVDASGRFLPPAELRQRWRERLAGRAPEDVIAMCGSGVTACHNLLSLEVAGLSGARLYAGSWSEWIRDPRRPIARG